MPIPDFQSCMLPILKLAADRNEHSLSEGREVLAAHFSLTDEERSEMLPSGRAPLHNQWGQTRLIQTQSRNKSSLIPLIASGVMQDAFCGSNYKLGFP
jgi:restriction system protein